MVRRTPFDKRPQTAPRSQGKGIGKTKGIEEEKDLDGEKTRPLLTATLGASLPASECQDTSVRSFAPRFLQAYVHHFEQFHRKLRKLQALDDFNLVPIEVPSRDVGRALVRYLDQQGAGVLLLEPRSWPTLVAQVLALPGREQDPRPVVIFGPRDWLEELPRALNLLNLQRDTIGQHLQRPLIWCGLRFFMEAMWDHAPDFWSIRNVTTQIPLESEPHVPLRTNLDPFAQPMVLLAKPQERKFTEPRALARALLDYVRSLLVHGRAGDASKPLRDAAKILLHEKKLRMTIEDVLYRELDADVAFALGNDAAAECAYQLALQGHRETGDAHGEARVWAKLARTTKRRHDLSKTMEQFDNALRLVDELGDLSLRAAILQARGSDYHDAKQRREALSDFDEAVKLFDKIGDTMGLARALVTRAFLRHDVDDYEGAGADLDQAMPMLSNEQDPVAWTNAHILRGFLYFQGKAYSNAKNVFDNLLQEKGYARHRSVRAWTLIESGRVRGALGLYNDAEKRLTKALELLGPDELTSWRADAYVERSGIRHQLGKWALSEHDARLARDLSRRPNASDHDHKFHYTPGYWFHQWHAHTLTHFGNFERAIAALDEAEEQVTSYASAARARVCADRAEIRARMGDLDGAWRDFEQCIVVQQENGSNAAEAKTRVLRASTWITTLQVSQEWIEPLQADLDRVLHALRPRASGECLAKAHLLRGDLYMRQEMLDQARADFDAAIAEYEALNKHAEMLDALRAHHEVCAALHDDAGARLDLERMIAIAEKHDDAQAVLMGGFAKATLAEKSGHIEQALRLLRQARDDRRSSNATSAFAEVWMAQMHHRYGHHRSALRLAHRALERAQGQPWRGLIEAHVADINASLADGNVDFQMVTINP